MKILYLITLFSIFSYTSSHAAEKWFQGYYNDDWSNLLNWDGGVPSDPTDDVRIFAACKVDTSVVLVMNSLVQTATGDLEISSQTEIQVINTTDITHSFYSLYINKGKINGTIKLVSSPFKGAWIVNSTINGTIEVDNLSTNSSEPLFLRDIIINGSITVGENTTTGADYSIRMGGTCDINPGSSLIIENFNKKGIVVITTGIININHPITFPANITKPCIESNGTINNFVSLEFTADPSNFLTAFHNKGTFTNYGGLLFPKTNQFSWTESGDFTNEECAFIKLEGRLYCTNNTGPNPYASITNKGMIQSSYKIENVSHYYGGSHTFNNEEGIVVSPDGKFSAPFDLNTGIKTKKIGFSSCGSGELTSFYDGSLSNIIVGDFYLDTMLTMPAGSFDAANNRMILGPEMIGINKVFVQITDGNSFCPITTQIIIDDFLEIKAFYADIDEDGFGDASDLLASCSLSVNGRVLDDNDCNDSDPNINPNASEFCDGIDSNCDGIGEGIGEEESVANTFNGAISNDWHTAGNWSLNTIPDFCSEVYIPANSTVDFNLLDDNISRLIVAPDARVNLNKDLYINIVESIVIGNEDIGILNEGIIYGPMNSIHITAAEGGHGIENRDSIYVSGINLVNLRVGLYNYENAGIQTHNLVLNNNEMVGIENEGYFHLSKALAPFQSYVSISASEMQETVINNFGYFVFDIDYYGGNEGQSEHELQSLIYNGGTLELNNTFSIFPQNTAENPVENEGELIISGICTLGGGLEFYLGELATLTIKNGGQLIFHN